MKTAIYIEDGVVQLVLTPENKFEKDALEKFDQHPTEAKIIAGQFYDCLGGWTRQKDFADTPSSLDTPQPPYHDQHCDRRSLIIRMEPKP